MSGFIFMLLLSLYLAGYGFIALFKQEWLTSIRAFSARLEGKGDVKREELTQNVGQARRIMAVLSLLLGVAGLVMSFMYLYLFIQAQSGPVAL